MADQRAQYNEEAVGANHPTKADVINRLALVEHGTDGVHGATARASMGTAPLVLGSDADGDMYYRASSKLARLAKGTANYSLFMNAAGTAPEWGTRSAMGVYSRDMTDASGDVNYSFSFVPSVLFAIGGNGVSMWSIGFSSGLSEYCLYSQSSDLFALSQDKLLYAYEGSGKSQDAIVKTLGTTTVLTWTKTGTTSDDTFYFSLLALR